MLRQELLASGFDPSAMPSLRALLVGLVFVITFCVAGGWGPAVHEGMFDLAAVKDGGEGGACEGDRDEGAKVDGEEFEAFWSELWCLLILLIVFDESDGWGRNGNQDHADDGNER